jgi:hypothetical protein
MPEHNWPLIDKTITWIEEHPELHRQESWAEATACGTTFCFAGAAAMLAGAEIPENLSTSDPHAANSWYLDEHGKLAEPWEAGSEHIAAYAAGILGLSGYEKDVLFYESGDTADLREYIEVMRAVDDIAAIVEESS